MSCVYNLFSIDRLRIVTISTAFAMLSQFWTNALGGVAIAAGLVTCDNKIKKWAETRLAHVRENIWKDMKKSAVRCTMDPNLIGTIWMPTQDDCDRYYDKFSDLGYALRHPYRFFVSQCPYINLPMPKKKASEKFRSQLYFAIKVDQGEEKMSVYEIEVGIDRVRIGH